MPNMTEDQKMAAHVRYGTQSNTPADVQGDVTWENSNPGAVRIDPATMGNRDVVLVAQAPGTSHVKGTATPIGGGAPIVLEADINVTAGVATQGTLTFDAPEPK